MALLALAFALIAHVAVAWFPFRLDPPRPVSAQVARLDDGSLALAGDRVVAIGPPPWHGRALDPSEAVVVDLEVLPAGTDQYGPARILEIGGDLADTNLMIGQDGMDLVVRVRRPGSDTAGNPPIRVPGAFALGDWIRCRVEVLPEGVSLALTGAPPLEAHLHRQTDAPPAGTWDPALPVRLGDVAPGGRVWHGTVRRAVVAAGGDEIDYARPGALDIARHTWYVPPRLREITLLPDMRAAARSIAHLVAFVPVGALLVAARRAAGPLSVAGWVLLFGTALQAGKVLFAGRHPSWLTVVMQVAGALAGAGAMLWLATRRHPPGPAGLHSREEQ